MAKKNTKKLKADDILVTHTFTFNPVNNGESLHLNTKFISNGDKGKYYTEQDFILQSMFNEARISLFGINITPDILRDLADELEDAAVAARKAAK